MGGQLCPSRKGFAAHRAGRPPETSTVFARLMFSQISHSGKYLSAVGTRHLGRAAMTVLPVLVQRVGVLIALAAHLALKLFGGVVEDAVLTQIAGRGESLVALVAGKGPIAGVGAEMQLQTRPIGQRYAAGVTGVFTTPQCHHRRRRGSCE